MLSARRGFLLLAALLFLGVSSAGAAVIEIGAMTVPFSWIDMDNVGPAGTTTLAAINAAGTNGGADLQDITFTDPTSPEGLYDFQTDRGRALAADRENLDILRLYDPGSYYGSMGSAIIDLGGLSTEFGFSIGDWSGPVNANLKLIAGNAGVGSITMSFVGSPNPHFLQSTVAFDRIELTLLPEDPQGNWVIPDLYVEQQAVPEPGTLLLLGLGLAGLSLRRRNQA